VVDHASAAGLSQPANTVIEVDREMNVNSTPHIIIVDCVDIFWDINDTAIIGTQLVGAIHQCDRIEII